MFIAHLPAGYIVSTLIRRQIRHSGIPYKAFMLSGMLGAIAPDVDLLYFYLWDGRLHPHHAYFTHFPIFWLALFILSSIWMAGGRTVVATLAWIFSLNGLLHLVLDTIVGDIRWLAPFDDRAFSLFAVEPHLHPWWLNFVLHWSFALELAITGAALVMWRKQARAKAAREAIIPRTSV